MGKTTKHNKHSKDKGRSHGDGQNAPSPSGIDPIESSRDNFPSPPGSGDGQNASSLDPFAAISAISAPYAALLQREFPGTWKALEGVNSGNTYTTASLVEAMHAQALAFL